MDEKMDLMALEEKLGLTKSFLNDVASPDGIIWRF